MKIKILILSISILTLSNSSFAQEASNNLCKNLAGNWKYIGGNDHKNKDDLKIKRIGNNEYSVKYINAGGTFTSYFKCKSQYKGQFTLTYESAQGGDCVGSTQQNESHDIKMWSACQSYQNPNHLNYYFYQKEND